VSFGNRKHPVYSGLEDAWGVYAFVRKAEERNRIFLCHKSFEVANSGLAACTLLHEPTHLEHIGNTEANPPSPTR
jgi:hypothetical protein